MAELLGGLAEGARPGLRPLEGGAREDQLPLLAWLGSGRPLLAWRGLERAGARARVRATVRGTARGQGSGQGWSWQPPLACGADEAHGVGPALRLGAGVAQLRPRPVEHERLRQLLEAHHLVRGRAVRSAVLARAGLARVHVCV